MFDAFCTNHTEDTPEATVLIGFDLSIERMDHTAYSTRTFGMDPWSCV